MSGKCVHIIRTTLFRLMQQRKKKTAISEQVFEDKT
jgi:hypothetical protein